MNWDIFIYFAMPTMLCWIIAALFCLKAQYFRLAQIIGILGLIILAIFIIGFWLRLERPPLRTLGETRLWYAFFLAFLGLLISSRWRYPWLLSINLLIAIVFLCINLFKPEIHSKTIMPALQSYWFIPHVIVYILSYALLAVATVASIKQLFIYNKLGKDNELLAFIDNLIYVGLGLLMLGLLFGAFWAKTAWGHYWSWDPKETWAFVTVVAYLIYIHLRLRNETSRLVISILPFAFILLLITWLGISYLPTAQNSVHTYFN